MPPGEGVSVAAGAGPTAGRGLPLGQADPDLAGRRPFPVPWPRLPGAVRAKAVIPRCRDGRSLPSRPRPGARPQSARHGQRSLAPRASWCPRPWGPLPPSPAAGSTSPTTSGSRSCRSCPPALLEGRDGLPVHPGAPFSLHLDRERLPVQRPPDTVLRLPSGLSSSMMLLPAALVDETNKATSKPAPSLPTPPRQAGGSALLRARPTASPATVSPLAPSRRLRAPLSPPLPGQQYPGQPSPIPCRRRKPGQRHLYAGHHLASGPGNRQAHPGTVTAPRF